MARRMQRVIGRIKAETDSIKTINESKTPGVFKGERWAKLFARLFTKPKSNVESQNGSPSASVSEKWDVAVKVKHKRPSKLLRAMKQSAETKTK